MTHGELLLRFAGILHFCVLIASALVPRTLNWREQLARLHPFLRTLFWTHGVFIVFTIIGFGTLTLLNAHALAAGGPLARSLCGFIAFFWLARLYVQLFVFDVREFLTNWFLRIGDHALTLVFLYFSVVYTWAACAAPF
jgi:hypothetical protein